MRQKSFNISNSVEIEDRSLNYNYVLDVNNCLYLLCTL